MTKPNKYYVNSDIEDRGDFTDSFEHICISPYEDDCADAICWMSDDLDREEAEILANIMCSALNVELAPK